MENLSINRKPNTILSPYSIQILGNYLYHQHTLNLQLKPDNYTNKELANSLTLENLIEELTQANNDRETLYCYLEDFLSDDSNPISQVILDLTT